jgi:hypothetical protein
MHGTMNIKYSVRIYRIGLRSFNFYLEIVSLPPEYQVYKEDTVATTEL